MPPLLDVSTKVLKKKGDRLPLCLGRWVAVAVAEMSSDVVLGISAFSQSGADIVWDSVMGFIHQYGVCGRDGGTLDELCGIGTLSDSA